MQTPSFSARVIAFKLAAALDQYEEDLRAAAETWLDADLVRRIQQDFSELRLLGASLPKVSVGWVAVLVSRAHLMATLRTCTGSVLAALQEHLCAVEGLRRSCLRSMMADGAALA